MVYFDIQELLKYSNEERLFPRLEGLYSQFDEEVLYGVVRKLEPRVVVDCAPREGRTTSVIVSALLKNIERLQYKINYFLFEKDEKYFNAIKQHLAPYANKIEFVFSSNIVDRQALRAIQNIDLLFIDANHDYMIARWFQEQLFPLANNRSVIHIHDVYYNKNGGGWEDATFIGSPQDHPDIVDPNVLVRLYPELFARYFDGRLPIRRFESDEVYDFYKRNSSHLEFFSTLDSARKLNRSSKGFPDCSMYFYLDDRRKLK